MFPVKLFSNESDLKPTPFDFDQGELDEVYLQFNGKCCLCEGPVVSRENQDRMLNEYQWIVEEQQLFHQKCFDQINQRKKVKSEIELLSLATQELQQMVQKKVSPTQKVFQSFTLLILCEDLIKLVTERPVGTGTPGLKFKRCGLPPLGCGTEQDIKEFALLCVKDQPLEILNSRSYSCLCNSCLCHPKKQNSNLLSKTFLTAIKKTNDELQIKIAMDNVIRKENPNQNRSKSIFATPEINGDKARAQWFHQKAKCAVCQMPLGGWAKCNDCWTPPSWSPLNGYWWGP